MSVNRSSSSVSLTWAVVMNSCITGGVNLLSKYGKNICHLHDGEVAVARGERLAAVELHLAPALLHARPQLAHVLLKLLHAGK